MGTQQNQADDTATRPDQSRRGEQNDASEGPPATSGHSDAKSQAQRNREDEPAG